jgi:hypothetical protein
MKKSLLRHTGFLFWAIFIIVLISILVFNWDRILNNFYELGAPIPHWLPRKQVIDAQPDPIPQNTPVLPGKRENNEPPNDQTPALMDDPAAQTPEIPILPSGRTRDLYFISVDQNGNLRLRAMEKTLSDTAAPLTETITALLQGLSENEREQGLISLIPEKTKILSVIIQQETAYLNFNEEFLYNTYGREGCIAQVQQVVWTATQFPTVKRVQILVEGRKESYLGDNIWIGDALTRENFL